jgi:hypothetical protein
MSSYNIILNPYFLMNYKTNNSNKLILLDILSLLFIALIERLIVTLSFANDSCTCITMHYHYELDAAHVRDRGHDV